MGLLNPHNLVWLASLAVLLAIYLRARAKPTLEVSSLMLFEEVAVPVASSRVLRTDWLFWLELTALAASSLALAGLYVRGRHAPAHHQSHALVFDLGAGMSARQGGGTRLDEARRAALALVSAARPGQLQRDWLRARGEGGSCADLASGRRAPSHRRARADGAAGASGGDAGGADARARRG